MSEFKIIVKNNKVIPVKKPTLFSLNKFVLNSQYITAPIKESLNINIKAYFICVLGSPKNIFFTMKMSSKKFITEKIPPMSNPDAKLKLIAKFEIIADKTVKAIKIYNIFLNIPLSKKRSLKDLALIT